MSSYNTFFLRCLSFFVSFPISIVVARARAIQSSSRASRRLAEDAVFLVPQPLADHTHTQLYIHIDINERAKAVLSGRWPNARALSFAK